jgi:predicted nucleic acid-binding Zn ribbon protein
MAKPHRMADVLGELLARRGYARVQAGEAMSRAWRVVAGEMAAQSRVGRVRRGVLEVVVANSTLLQELTFRKRELVGALARELPDQPLQDVRFRLGQIE